MTIKRRFINDVYGGNYAAYRQARKRDLCKVRFEFACYIDGLCKDGEITEKEYNNTIF